MKNICLVAIILSVFFACTEKDEGLKLEKNSDEYNFAKEISQKIPVLDPDLNKVLVETKWFNITTGNVFDALFKNFSRDLGKLKEVDTTRLKRIFNENASLLAEKQMIITAAKNNDFEITKFEIDSILQVQYDKTGSKEKFEKYLANNNISLDYIVEDYKNTLLIQKYLKNAVKDSIIITDDEIQKILMQIKSVSVRHIFFNTKGLNENEKNSKRKKLEEIRKLAKNGQSFSDLAKKFSEDQNTSKNGGLIRNIKRGDMLDPFDKISFSLAIGEISDVFETPMGFHILTVIGRNKEGRPVEKIREDLFESKQKKILPKIIDSLKTKFKFVQNKI